MSVYPKIKIKTDLFHTEIFINGNRINGVRAITFGAEVDTIPTVLLELNALDAEIEGKMEAIIAALEGEEKDADVQTTGES